MGRIKQLQEYLEKVLLISLLLLFILAFCYQNNQG